MNADVVVVTWNHAATLAATLASLADQTCPVRRVVVLDNASEDGSLDIARSFASRLPIEAVQCGGNLGFSAACNEGFRRTSSPWVLSLNPDCRLAPDAFENLRAAPLDSVDLGIVAPLLLRGEGRDLAPTTTIDSAGMVFTAAGRHHDRESGREYRPELGVPAWVFGATGAAAVYRREALEDVAYPGGEVFDERFFGYREDADLAWRLQSRGWRCLFWPSVRGFHRRGLRPEAGRPKRSPINRYSVRNRFLLRWSNADWRWYLACFPTWMVRDLIVAGACLSVERESLPGLTEALRLRRIQRRRGRENAARRRVNPWSLIPWFFPGGRVRPHDP